MRHLAQIKNGIIYPLRPQRFDEELTAFNGKNVEVIITEENPDASKDQFGYYFATLKWLCDNTEYYGGNEPKVLDNHFCKKYLSYEKAVVINNKTTIEKFVQSKSTLNKKDMNAFITKVFAEIAEEACFTPPTPEEAVLRKFKTTVQETPQKNDENLDDSTF